MAAAQLNLTRRALLGAACVPALVDGDAAAARGPLHHASHGPPPRPGEDWERALGAVPAAQADVAEIEAARAGAPVAEEEAWLPRHEASCERLEAALARVVALPAPHLEGFAAKLELLFAHVVEPGAVDESWTAAIGEDAPRLLQRG
jgi:hypothetical protein